MARAFWKSATGASTWPRRYRQAVADFHALAIRPDDIFVQTWYFISLDRVRFEDFAADRQRQWNGFQLTINFARQRQLDLVVLGRPGPAVRDRSGSSVRTEADNRVRLDVFVPAAEAPVLNALNSGSLRPSGSACRSASSRCCRRGGRRRAAIVIQNIANARLQAEQAQQLRVAQFTATCVPVLRQVREQQLQDAQRQLGDERVRKQKSDLRREPPMQTVTSKRLTPASPRANSS